VKKELGEQLESLRKAAAQGDAVAQLIMGHRYDNGEGIAQDYAEAVKWYRKSAEQDHVLGQSTLAWISTEQGSPKISGC
jgi:uncharacterized protein